MQKSGGGGGARLRVQDDGAGAGLGFSEAVYVRTRQSRTGGELCPERADGESEGERLGDEGGARSRAREVRRCTSTGWS